MQIKKNIVGWILLSIVFVVGLSYMMYQIGYSRAYKDVVSIESNCEDKSLEIGGIEGGNEIINETIEEVGNDIATEGSGILISSEVNNYLNANFGLEIEIPNDGLGWVYEYYNLKDHNSDEFHYTFVMTKEGYSIEIGNVFDRGDTCGFDAGEVISDECYTREFLTSGMSKFDYYTEYIVEGRTKEVFSYYYGEEERDIYVLVSFDEGTDITELDSEGRLEIMSFLSSLKDY